MKNYLVLFIILSCTAAAQVPAEGLIAYYPFNGSANDQSGNGFHGVISGATLTTDRRGESISAFSFDGINDGISVSGFNQNPQTFTISLWFFARTDGDAASKELLQRSDPADKNNWSWNISWYKKNGPSKTWSGVKTTGGTVSDSSDSSPKNNWNHVVMTWDGTTKKVYLNGVLKRIKSLPGYSINYSGQTGLFIGFDSETGYFNGKIDDIRIYNRVLSLTEINELANEGEINSVRLLSPAGGEDFVAGANHEIKWTGIGVQSVKIEYSLDSGMTWVNLVSYFNNTGVYVWTTPNVTAYNCLIKISSSSNPLIYDISRSVFSVEQYKIKILSPDGDEMCGINQAFAIKWNSNNIQTVNIDYSTDNGASWIPVAQNIPSSGVYEWLVPNTPSIQALVKITNTDTALIADISSNNFIITEITGVEDPGNPESFTLMQNFPNPFNPRTVIKYSLPADSFVELKIFDIRGREVSTAVSTFMHKGTYEYRFNGEGLSSGIYFYKFTAAGNSITRKMQLVK